MRKNKRNKTLSVFWYAGVCVGSTVLAGKTVTNALGSGVSTVGGVCRRVLRIDKAAVKDVIVEDHTPKPDRGGLVAWVAHTLNITRYPIAMAGALTTRLKRVHTAVRDQTVLAVARPVVEGITVVAGPRKSEVPRLREKATVARVEPVGKETPSAAVPTKPQTPPYRRETTVFPEVLPEEADAADFATSVQKIVLKRALSDLSRPDSDTRVHAASVAGGLRHPLAMRALAGQLSRDESAEVRRACLAALAALGMEEGFAAAEHALQDTDNSVRVAAVIAVYRLGGPRSVAALARMLRDPNAEVRRVTVSCIGWLRQVDLSGQIAPLLSDGSVHVRLSALEAISNLRGHEAVPALIERLGDPVESVRRKTFTVLQEITGKKMGEHYPENDADRELLMARWRHWWREEAGHRSAVGN